MKKHLIFQKALAILCALTLLPFGNFSNTAKAAEVTTPDGLQGFTALTLEDAGISDRQNSVASGFNSLKVKSLDRTLFSMKVAYSTAGSRFHYGMNNSHEYSGISFRFENGILNVGNEVGGNGIANLPWSLVTIDPQNAGVGKTFVNNEFLLQLSTEFVDHDNGGSDNDIKLGIFINGKLYNNQYYYVDNSAEQLGTNINFNEGVAALLASYYGDDGEVKKAENLEGFTELTLLDAGLTDCRNAQRDGYNSLNVDNLDHTLFSIRLAYAAANGSRFHYGVNSTNSYSGISFRLEKTSEGAEVLNVGNEVGGNGIANLPWSLTKIDPVAAGVGETFVNTEFLLQISTEFVDHDNGGTNNDIKLGIFINGDLYNRRYFYIDNGAEQIGTNFNFNAGAAALLGSYTRDSGIAYEQWTIGRESEDPLDGSEFSAMVNFTAGNLWIGNGEGNGYVVAAEGGATGSGLSLQLWLDGAYQASYSLKDEEAGCQLRRNNRKLTLKTEKIGNKGVKLGIYFDNKLYGGSAIYMTKAPELRRHVVVTGQVEATAIKYIEDVKGYDFLTLKDAGIADAKNSVFNGSFSRKSMDKTITSMKLAYKRNSARMHLGKKDSDYGGLAFRLENGSIIVGNEMGGKTGEGYLVHCPWVLVNIEPEKAGVGNTFLDAEFLLQISVAFVDQDQDGTKNDIEIGVYINGVLYNNQFYYIKDDAEYFMTGINFNEATADYASYEMQEEEPTDISELIDYDFLTLSDAGIANGTGSFNGSFSRESMDRTVTSVKLTYRGNGARMHLGTEENNYGGLAFRLENGNLVVGNEQPGKTEKGCLNNCPWVLAEIDPERVDVENAFLDTEFLLQISVAFVDHDLDGKKNDIELGIFINGTLYNNMFVYIKDNAEQLGTGINFNEGTADYTSFNDIHDLKEITAADFGLINAVIMQDKEVKSNDSMLVGTALTMMMKFPEEQGNCMYVGGKGNGLKLETQEDGTIKVSYTEAEKETALTTLTPQKAKIASFGEELEWRFEFSKQVVSGLKKLVLGIYIEDVLYEYQYITLKNVDTDSLQRVLGIHVSNGKFEITAPGYEELTFHDFSVVDKKFTAPMENGYRENYRNWDAMDETAVTGIVNFGAIRAGRIQYGNSSWYGLILTPENEDAINVYYVSKENGDKRLAVLRPEKAGVSSFIGEDTEIRTTFDMLKAEDGTVNMKVGIYINGKLYDDQFILVRDINPETFTKKIAYWTYEGDHTFEVKSIKRKPDLSIYGF